ncbi:MAG: GDP-mannose 4,6-dehydratase [Armatimonadota bacterium]
MHALVTGGAGFIGSQLVTRLLQEGWLVTAVDNFDDFYAPALKQHNIQSHLTHPNYHFIGADIRNPVALEEGLTAQYDVLIHLAAKAGVRLSVLNPQPYLQVNIQGTLNMLEFARTHAIPQFVFSSSSSVYGLNSRVPWCEDDLALAPASPYAASKISGELLGHAYSHLYGMRFIALRFFTAYGPCQRPDLAIHKFARLIRRQEIIPIYGDGSTRRDYTYVDDIVDGIYAALSYSATPFEIINLGNNHTRSVIEMLRGLEEVLGMHARIEYRPEQPGDVPITWADIEKAQHLLDYHPDTDFHQGLKQFVTWLDELEGTQPQVTLAVNQHK